MACERTGRIAAENGEGEHSLLLLRASEAGVSGERADRCGLFRAFLGLCLGVSAPLLALGGALAGVDGGFGLRSIMQPPGL